MCATVVLDAGPTEVAVPGFAGNRPGALLALGLWAGITYGDLEALEVVLLSLVPGALSWRSGNSLDALWFAPLFYGTVFLLLALPLAALARHTRRVPWDSALVFLYVAIGGFFGFTLRE